MGSYHGNIQGLHRRSREEPIRRNLTAAFEEFGHSSNALIAELIRCSIGEGMRISDHAEHIVGMNLRRSRDQKQVMLVSPRQCGTIALEAYVSLGTDVPFLLVGIAAARSRFAMRSPLNVPFDVLGIGNERHRP